jgi:hypothetical protein
MLITLNIVENKVELTAALNRLFTHSPLLIVQEYLYTVFDWRVARSTTNRYLLVVITAE